MIEATKKIVENPSVQKWGALSAIVTAICGCIVTIVLAQGSVADAERGRADLLETQNTNFVAALKSVTDRLEKLDTKVDENAKANAVQDVELAARGPQIERATENDKLQWPVIRANQQNAERTAALLETITAQLARIENRLNKKD